MRVVLGADHGGCMYKEQIKKMLIARKYEVIDVGTNSITPTNYAYYGIEAAKKIALGEADFGILVCGSGEGISIAANKVKGVRCGIGYSDEVTKLTRLHNDANMIAFGARFMTLDDVKRRTILFLETPFEGGRHIERVDTIINFEK